MLILTHIQGIIGLIIATRRKQPFGQIWQWLLASAVFHTAVKLFWAYGYQLGCAGIGSGLAADHMEFLPENEALGLRSQHEKSIPQAYN